MPVYSASMPVEPVRMRAEVSVSKATCPEALKLVVVALVRSVLPESVVEAMIAERLALSWPPTLSTEVMVDEPVTANADEVAEVKVAPVNVEAVVPGAGGKLKTNWPGTGRAGYGGGGRCPQLP